MATKQIKSKQAKTGIVSNVRDSAQQIWLAGLGAFSKAQKESASTFDALVKEGQSLDKELTKSREKAVKQVRESVDSNVTALRQRGNKLETMFEQRVQKALASLNIPTKEDIDALNKKIDALHKEIRNLNSGSSKAA